MQRGWYGFNALSNRHIRIYLRMLLGYSAHHPSPTPAVSSWNSVHC